MLLDLSLVLFVGILIGAYSSIFIATPLLVSLRRRDASVVELEKKAARYQARKAKDVAAAEAAHAAGEPLGEPVVGRQRCPRGRRGRGRHADRPGRAQVRPADPGRPAQPAAAHAQVQALTR